MGLDVSIWAAFFAGFLSFLSPCVLPLVPPYLCFLAGASLEELTGEHPSERIARKAVILSALAFVLGFSTVFVALGATASALGGLLRDYLQVLSQIAGVAIIVMGLHFVGVYRWLGLDKYLGFLAREARYQHEAKPAGLIGAYVIGLAFAFGWTPCIGPVLAAILALAASEDSVSKGAWLLAVYSAGLGVPFLAAAMGINGFLGFSRRFRKHLGIVEIFMGVLLVLTGIGFMTGYMATFSYWLLEMFPALANIG